MACWILAVGVRLPDYVLDTPVLLFGLTLKHTRPSFCNLSINSKASPTSIFRNSRRPENGHSQFICHRNYFGKAAASIGWVEATVYWVQVVGALKVMCKRNGKREVCSYFIQGVD
ncbi:hypothetical protein JTE90_002734 [Oedothorax gibbosus]|uniref:Uncharacterized protein n=1 Tax=Oedothorax gibbosus TaxID=931172 RepID=A0AAV6VWB3_9ARAC|nr:hypothetical protein JTE90_002734 [Oedothorax gibbosus]